MRDDTPSAHGLRRSPLRTPMAKVAFAFLAGITLLSCIEIGSAESLWKRRSHSSAFIFHDNRARNVGDLLTVRIRELTTVDNDEGRTLAKDTDKRHRFNFIAGAAPNGTRSEVGADHDIRGRSNRSLETNSQFESDRVFVDELTVTVLDVLPNGNLVVSGFRHRMVSDEMRKLRISGIVRANDIESTEEGNFVDSRFVANFRVAYEGEGVESKFTRQGFLGR
ncbi:MAG: flagellar basal body L-ring protein FlgH, partial [Planctomycetota bacterium]|nr:flagellar basal body L-ring protein FlgH [Planctomycetota bacterium]